MEPADASAGPTPWHAIEVGDALQAVQADKRGLSQDEAARRLASAGPNAISPPGRESVLEELLESLREPLQLLLVVVGILSAVWGELRDAIAIIAAVAGIETATEFRARRALDGLRSLTAPRARVLRDGLTGNQNDA